MSFRSLPAIAAVVSMICPSALAVHRPLLPAPQQIQYRPGLLSLSDLAIQLSPEAAPEDRFAANRLSTCLSKSAGSTIRIIDSSSAGRVLKLERTGAVDTLAQPGETAGPNSRESYSIKITADGGQLRAKSSAGLYYGVQTLCQMVEGNHRTAALPDAAIHDWPSFAYRGVMVDTSEGPTPTAEEIKRQIDFLSRWKINQYYLYSSTNIHLNGFPLLSPFASYSQSEIRSIVSYARQRHIDVIPTLELYGHLHQLFIVQKYSGLSDFPHGGEFNPKNPQVEALLKNWVAQYAQLFPSPFVHIGFDETWEIQEAAQQEQTTPVALFVQQLNNVSSLFEEYGKHILAWEDIMVKFPGIIPQLPKGLIAVAWWYSSSPDPTYHHWLAPLVEHHVPHMIATGVNGWSEIVPDFPATFSNIDTFVAAGRKSRAIGMMNTIWGDDAQLLMRMSWPGLAYGAAAAWQQEPVDRANFFANYAAQMYPDAAPNLSQALSSLSQSETALENVMGQATMDRLWHDPFTPHFLRNCAEHRSDLRQTRLLAEDADARLREALADGENPLTLKSLLFGAQLLDYAGMRYQYACQLSSGWARLGQHPPPQQLSSLLDGPGIRLRDLVDTITALRPLYKQEWLTEYYPYRLGSALDFWNGEAMHWRRLDERLQQIEFHFKAGDQLPSLQSVADAAFNTGGR